MTDDGQVKLSLRSLSEPMVGVSAGGNRKMNLYLQATERGVECTCRDCGYVHAVRSYTFAESTEDEPEYSREFEESSRELSLDRRDYAVCCP